MNSTTSDVFLYLSFFPYYSRTESMHVNFENKLCISRLEIINLYCIAVYIYPCMNLASYGVL